MFPTSRTAWIEGMLMEPQHFQQQERFFEHHIDGRLRAVQRWNWGFSQIEINHALLDQGKIALTQAKGIFPDGTPFSLPGDGPLPLPLALEEAMEGQQVCLTLTLDLPDTELASVANARQGSRLALEDAQIKNRYAGISSPGNPDMVTLQIARLNCRLQLKNSVTGAETALPLLTIRERSANGALVIDSTMLPPLLDYRACGWLKDALNELMSLIRLRLESVFRNDVHSAVGGLSELLELLLLQTLSHAHLHLAHLSQQYPVHPEQLYQQLLTLLGQLSIIPDGERLWERQDLQYQHDEPHMGFFPLFTAIRRALSLVIEAPAVALLFKQREDGIWICPTDAQLRLEKIVFAISCDLPADQLRLAFPAQTKMGAVERISHLIDLQLPGARLLPMVSAPRHIPWYPNSVYFEVDNNDSLCREMYNASAMAVSIVGDFPGLRFDVWGLRQGRIA
ncbi:type VI secretion system baseplate subunit TssK [Pantoea sp. NPDC088449]|uniref:type VI secretion system baseplate subunit TssK n=1 Tax=Pantoea sp. NPDC088449 TaxID=3364392 RepID=UPI0037F11869